MHTGRLSVTKKRHERGDATERDDAKLLLPPRRPRAGLQITSPTRFKLYANLARLLPQRASDHPGRHLSAKSHHMVLVGYAREGPRCPSCRGWRYGCRDLISERSPRGSSDWPDLHDQRSRSKPLERTPRFSLTCALLDCRCAQGSRQVDQQRLSREGNSVLWCNHAHRLLSAAHSLCAPAGHGRLQGCAQ